MILESLLQHKTLTSDPVGNPPTGYIYVYAKSDGIYAKNDAGTVIKLNKEITVSTTAPLSPQIGDLWVDTNP